MGAPLNAGLPPGLDLGRGYTIRFAAIDATTGNAVAGVKVSGCSILTADTSGGDSGSLLADVEPLWLNLPSDLTTV